VPAETETIIEVLESHCDGLDHLNHVKAVLFLEKARDAWYRACGLWGDESGRRYGTVVVNINYNYRRECFLGERLRVMTRAHSMGSKSYTLSHEIIKPDGSVAIDGVATSVVMDLKSRSIISVPECLATSLPPRN
jgi:YbgC/YbaW family acyl-CoA thioester hydrolase